MLGALVLNTIFIVNVILSYLVAKKKKYGDMIQTYRNQTTENFIKLFPTVINMLQKKRKEN